MSSLTSGINTANTIAELAGLFNVQMVNGSYTNPNQQTVSFHIVTQNQVPIAEYLSGLINGFNFMNGAIGGASIDPNEFLFNTALTATGLNETVMRKHTINRIPYANYDMPVDLGIGGQRINFNIAFTGTMYQTAFQNFIQALYSNSTPGLGTLTHPFYGTINNVLPLSITGAYESTKMNYILLTVPFQTSDINHLYPNTNINSILAEIGRYYIGIQNSVSSIGGIISGGQAIGSNLTGGLL